MTSSDLEDFREALEGNVSESASLLARTCVEVGALLVRKNRDYGNSGHDSPLLAPNMTSREGLQCRMSDKIARLRRLLGGETASVEESVEDTFRDLAGYCVLWLTAKEQPADEIEDERTYFCGDTLARMERNL